MTARGRFKRALPAALLVHTCQTLCAALIATPVLTRVAGVSVDDTAAVQALIALLQVFESLGKLSFRTTFAPLLVTALAGPFWRVLWLRATQVRAPLDAHARIAASRYRAALAVTAAGASYALVLLLAAAGAALGAARVCAPLADERTTSIASIAAASPFLIALWLHPAALIDLASAALATGTTSIREALRDARSRQRGSLLLLRAGFESAGWMLILGSWFSARAAFGLGTSASAATLVITQLAAFAASCLRGMWFATLLARRHSSAPEHHPT